MGNIRVALAQLNSVVGDLEGNVERIQEVLPNLDDCDLAIFPEMTITGYPLEDLVLKPGFRLWVWWCAPWGWSPYT